MMDIVSVPLPMKGMVWRMAKSSLDRTTYPSSIIVVKSRNVRPNAFIFYLFLLWGVFGILSLNFYGLSGGGVDISHRNHAWF